MPVSLHVVNLTEVRRFDATAVSDGPIRDVRLVRWAPGGSLDLDADRLTAVLPAVVADHPPRRRPSLSRGFR